MVTSGIYERYFEKDGKIYHHILDAYTGYPVNNDIASVTVISKNGTVADALSTAFLCMGVEQTRTYLKSHSDINVIFIMKDGSRLDL